MAYCTLEHVRAINPNRVYGATSKPNTEQIDQFITWVAARIDGVLAAKGLKTPVTEPAALVAYLEWLNALGAASDAERAMFPTADKYTGRAAELARAFEAELERLAAGDKASILTSPPSTSPVFSYASEHPSKVGRPHIRLDREF